MSTPVDIKLETALLVIDVLSVVASMILLQRLFNGTWGITTMLKVVTVVTYSHMINSSLYVLQLTPLVVAGSIEKEKGPWTGDNFLCKAIAITLQVTVVSDFLWSGLFIWLFLMILRGKTTEQMEESYPYQCVLLLIITLIAAVVPFFDRSHNGGYGYVPDELQCWIRNPVYRNSLYVILMVSFVFAVAVMFFAGKNWRVFKKAPKIVRKMIIFLIYFAAFWALPIIRRAMGFWGYNPFGELSMKILRTLSALEGICNCLLWTLILKAETNASGGGGIAREGEAEGDIEGEAGAALMNNNSYYNCNSNNNHTYVINRDNHLDDPQSSRVINYEYQGGYGSDESKDDRRGVGVGAGVVGEKGGYASD